MQVSIQEHVPRLKHTSRYVSYSIYFLTAILHLHLTTLFVSRSHILRAPHIIYVTIKTCWKHGNDNSVMYVIYIIFWKSNHVKLFLCLLDVTRGKFIWKQSRFGGSHLEGPMHTLWHNKKMLNILLCMWNIWMYLPCWR